MKSSLPWPAFLDLLTSTLMVFLLFSFLQSAFSQQNLQALEIQQKQKVFVKHFETALSDDLAQGTITLDAGTNFLQVTFADRVLFESGDYHLLPPGQELLERLGAFLATGGATSYRSVQVEGHTDNRPLGGEGYPANNWQLSAARAISVVELLTADPHIDGTLFHASGFADLRPVADNSTDEGRARNRRIELRIFFEELSSLPGGESR